jgi:two-component system, cell cycle sensor histidine kinase and response regulator CckA
VLLNLAVNARDAMPGGGRLRLRAFLETVDETRAARNQPLKPGPCVAFSVTDTGTGIPPEVVEHMFEPFFTTKPLGKGTGLGLSTVYGIVRAHGGAIEVQTQPGHGTVFTVLLPALVRAAPERRDSRPPVAVPFAGAGRRILVVDDEEPIRLITQHALQRHDYIVETASDGAEGWEIFRKDPARFAAVVTDLMMPRMNGREMIREMRRLAQDVPIIASSGLAEENSEIGSREGLAPLGVRLILRKPYTEADLLSALRQELDGAPTPGPQKNG